MKKKKSPQQIKEALRKKAVKLAKEIAKEKAGYQCEFVDENGVRCYRSKEAGNQMHGSHIKSEGSHRSMSADVDNIQCHCAGHHTGMGQVTPNWHDDPLLMIMLFAKQQPERAEMLNLRAREIPVCDLKYWEDKLKRLKAKI